MPWGTPDSTPPADALLGAAEVAHKIGLRDADAVRRAVRSNEFPPPDTVLHRMPYWRQSTVRDHLAAVARAIQAAFGCKPNGGA